MRFIFPLALILIAVVGFFSGVSPLMDEVKALRADIASYDQALSNARDLKDERDRLTRQFNSFQSNDLRRLETSLPNSVNNIRLILEIEGVAAPYGMVLRDVRYDAAREANPEAANNNAVQAGGVAVAPPQDYGTWTLEFSTEGSYGNFLNFLRNLESNLRLIDIASIQFASSSAATSAGASPSVIGSYRYNFKIQTYWLRNPF